MFNASPDIGYIEARALRNIDVAYTEAPRLGLGSFYRQRPLPSPQRRCERISQSTAKKNKSGAKEVASRRVHDAQIIVTLDRSAEAQPY